jgi:hypothetical protein
VRTAPDSVLVARIEDLLGTPVFFRDVLAATKDRPYRDVLKAWSSVRENHPLLRDEQGRYSLRPS